MSLPPIDPSKTASGIAVDPRTLERVIPESRRSDGRRVYSRFSMLWLIIARSVRKQLKIRPGFTPQEDVRRFRGTKQAQMDANSLPKGHIIGWTPPPSKEAEPSKSMSKSAKKNAKRREKKAADKEPTVKDNWEDDDDETPAAATSPSGKQTPTSSSAVPDPKPSNSTDSGSATTAETLSSKMEKLNVH